MQAFIVAVLINAIKDPELQAAVKKLITDPEVLAALEKLIGSVVAKQILPVIPVAIGAAVKTAVDDIVHRIPGISGTVDAVKTAESAAASIVDLIPGLGSLPIIGDFLNSWKL